MSETMQVQEGVDVEVHVVSWPEAEDLRQKLADAGEPRLLLVRSDCAPPQAVDALEDWVREPANVVEVLARMQTLRARMAERARGPRFDGGILRVGDRWLAIPEAQRPIVAVLIGRLGTIVRTKELASIYAAHGGSNDPVAFKAVMYRLSKRLAPIGLRLHNLRGKGSLLELAEP